MQKFAAALAALGLLASSAMATAAETTEFKPASPWNADYGDDYCRLARNFSDGQHQITLALERIQPTNSVRVILIGDDFRMYRGSTELELALLPSGGTRKGPFWRSETADKHTYLNLGQIVLAPQPAMPDGAGPIAPPPLPAAGSPAAAPPAAIQLPPYSRSAEQDFASGIDAIAVTGGMIDLFQLDTGNLKAPIAALQACADDLAGSWGLDPAKLQGMTRAARPASSPRDWLPSGTISFRDFDRLAGAANQFRVMVGADGKPTGCFVHWASLDDTTNKKVCNALMAKGEFVPALDKDGQPMASYWVTLPMALMEFGRR